MSVPVIVKVLSVFVLVVIANGRGLHLGLAAFVGAFLVGIWHGEPVARVGALAFESVFSADSLFLSLILAGITALSTIMKRSGGMDAIVRSYRGLARSPRMTIATLPTLIGVLPMPGGAIFSAPMVAAVDAEGRLTPGERATANYWFRHAIELVWPLYPSFILASSITGLSPARLSLVNLYSPVVLVLAGSLFLLRKYSDSPRRAGPDTGTKGSGACLSAAESAAPAPAAQGPFAAASASASASASVTLDMPFPPQPAAVPSPGKRESARTIPMREHLRDFVRAFSPVLLILAVAFLGDLALDAAMPALLGLFPRLPAAVLSRYLPILAGVTSGILLLAGRNPGIPIGDAILTGATLKIVATVVGVKVFSFVLERIGVASAVAAELSGLGVPGPVVIALLPLFAGLVTGIGFGYVGLAYPIVLALLPSGDTGMTREGAVVLAGAFGFAGMMLSPLHVCMVVTAEHFGTKLVDTIRRIGAPLAAFLAIAALWSVAISFFPG